MLTACSACCATATCARPPASTATSTWKICAQRSRNCLSWVQIGSKWTPPPRPRPKMVPPTPRTLRRFLGGRCRIRTCDPCRVNARKGDGRGYLPLASIGNHDGHTSTHNWTDQQALAAFRERLAAFLLHGPARLLTVREIAKLLAVSTPIVYRLCERGHLACVRVGNAIRIAPSALFDFVTGGSRG